MAAESRPGADDRRSLVPARLDRLPWTSFHNRILAALGASWLLDGLEIQLISQVGTVLADRGTLELTDAQIGWLASVYLLGEVIGALVFGRITDRYGRKRLFFATLVLYLLASGIAGLSPTVWFLLVFRFLAGAGIGGEYTAINSAIDEMIPPYYRGWADILVNGTYWAGALLGAAANLLLLNPHLVPTDLGWRLAFLVGPMIAVVVVVLRSPLVGGAVPESPRWLISHGKNKDAEEIVKGLEDDLDHRGVHLPPLPVERGMPIRPGAASYREIADTMLRHYLSRSVLGLTLMVSQAVLYNAVFFNFSLILVRFFAVPDRRTSYLLLPFAAANLLGPLLLARLFDIVGRRRMIAFTYGVAGLGLVSTAGLFGAGLLDAATQTVAWCVVFFFASAGASSAYLTISEIFPLELRAQAISFFFAVSLAVGGVLTPTLFGRLVAGGAGALTLGYAVLAAVMCTGALVAWLLGVDAERKSLEEIADPLAAARGVIEPRIL